MRGKLVDFSQVREMLGRGAKQRRRRARGVARAATADLLVSPRQSGVSWSVVPLVPFTAEFTLDRTARLSGRPSVAAAKGTPSHCKINTSMRRAMPRVAAGPVRAWKRFTRILNRIRAGYLARVCLVVIIAMISLSWSASLVGARERHVSEVQDSGEADDVNGIRGIDAPQIGTEGYIVTRTTVKPNVSVAVSAIIKLQTWRFGPMVFLIRK